MVYLHLNEEARQRESDKKASRKRVLQYAQDVIDEKLTKEKAWEKIKEEMQKHGDKSEKVMQNSSQ